MKPLWDDQPTYLISQLVYMLAGLVTLTHGNVIFILFPDINKNMLTKLKIKLTFSALNKGGRWPYFWLGTILHGLYTDNFWHFALPEYDNFWHSQTPIMLLGARLPLHIIFLCKYVLFGAIYLNK